MKHKITAIAGSPGCGKTITAIKMALALERRKKSVMVISLDVTCPTIPYTMEDGTGHETSVGTLFTQADVSREDILRACTPVPGHPNIVMLGYKMGDSYSLYPQMLMDRIKNCIIQARHITEYVIIDCVSVIEADAPTIAALEAADRIIRLGSADLKGISYYASMDRILGDPRFRKDGGDGHVSAVSNLWAGQAWEMVAQKYGGTSHRLPHCAELAAQYDSRRLFDELSGREGMAYTEAVNGLVTAAFGTDGTEPTLAGAVEKAQKEKKGVLPPGKTAGKEKKRDGGHTDAPAATVRTPALPGLSKPTRKKRGFGILSKDRGEW